MLVCILESARLRFRHRCIECHHTKVLATSFVGAIFRLVRCAFVGDRSDRKAHLTKPGATTRDGQSGRMARRSREYMQWRTSHRRHRQSAGKCHHPTSLVRKNNTHPLSAFQSCANNTSRRQTFAAIGSYHTFSVRVGFASVYSSSVP